MRKNPGALLFFEETQDIIDRVIAALELDPDRPIKELIERDELEFVKDDYDRIATIGETSLHGLIDAFYLPMITSNGAIRTPLTGTQKQPKRIYHYNLVCGIKGVYEGSNIIKRNELEMIRSYDMNLGSRGIECDHCDKAHIPSKSYFEYDFGSSTIVKLYKKCADTETSLAKIKSKHRDRSSQIKTLESKLNDLKKTIAQFEQEYEAYGLFARVKGVDSFVNKFVDRIYQLDEKLPDTQKQKDKVMPTAIKDFFGLKILVTGERGLNAIIGYLDRHFDDRNGSWLDSAKDYWGVKRKEKNGIVQYEGWKRVARYHENVPIEIQIQDIHMRNKSELDHPSYHSRNVERRKQLEALGFPITKTTIALEQMLSGTVS